MAYRFQSSKTGAGGGKGASSNIRTQYGRVVSIITSVKDPRCKDTSMVGGLFYRVPDITTDETEANTLSFAYPGSSTIRILPMEGELVEIQKGPGTSPGQEITYWGNIVNVWNHPHHNVLPDTNQPEWDSRILGGKEEQATINPMVMSPGDLLIEGRLGQSIRMGGNKGMDTTLVDSSNEGKPIIVISNGQINTSEGNSPIEEDINKDNNSIYLVSDHKIPLVAANTKQDTYKTKPLTSNQYKGNQIVQNAGRIYINAKEESVLISAKEAVGLNGKTVNIDGEEYFCVDAKKIYLGKGALNTPSSTAEPVILGKQLENWLGTLLDALDTLSNALSTAAAVSGGPVTGLNAAGPALQATVQSLKSQIKLVQSKKVFTE